MSECLYEWISMNVRKMKKRRVIVVVTLLSRNAWLSCVIPASPIWFWERQRWVSVCVSECRWMWERWRREEWLLLLLLCCLVMLDSALSFLHRQFDCWRGRDEWVSAWVNVDECEKDKEEKKKVHCKKSKWREWRFCFDWSIGWKKEIGKREKCKRRRKCLDEDDTKWFEC